MSMLEFIKAEKNMTLDHWRFKLLHWCFNEDPKYRDLPKHFYTHYCGLFHLTNLIAICLPLIFVIKIITAMVIATYHTMVTICEYLEKRKEQRNKTEEKPEQNTRRKELGFLSKVLREHWEAYNTFSHFWNQCGNSFQIMSQEEVENKHAKLIAKFGLAEEIAEKKRKAMHERITFWVNFSRGFFSIGLNVFYIALACLVGYLCLLSVGPTITFIKWLFTCNPIPAILIGCKAAAACGVAVLFVWLSSKYRVVQTVFDKSVDCLKPVMLPFGVIVDVCTGLFEWCVGVIENIVEFISTFYEESCPTINLTEEEE